MILNKISNMEIIKRLEKLVSSERKITHLILLHINEVESRRLYSELGFDSMFKYLIHLGYSEDSAYRRLQAARLLKKVPAITEKLESGALNLTQLTQVQKCLRQVKKEGELVSSEQTNQILKQIENKSSYETQKILAVEFNQPVQTRTTLKPQQDDSLRLEVTLTQEQMKFLNDAKDLLSHVIPDGSWAEVLSHLAKFHVQRSKGKIKKQIEMSAKTEAEGNDVRDVSSSEIKLTPSFLVARQAGQRKSIKLTSRRKIFSKADQCCQYVSRSTGVKCTSTYQLQIDHIVPLAKGGVNGEENLRILCRSHNLQAAKDWGLKTI